MARYADAFQAYDEGSIPFTRSNLRVFAGSTYALHASVDLNPPKLAK